MSDSASIFMAAPPFFPIQLPPLRERTMGLERLWESFAAKYIHEYSMSSLGFATFPAAPPAWECQQVAGLDQTGNGLGGCRGRS